MKVLCAHTQELKKYALLARVQKMQVYLIVVNFYFYSKEMEERHAYIIPKLGFWPLDPRDPHRQFINKNSHFKMFSWNSIRYILQTSG